LYRHQNRGFSLIELLIVVAIILTIAAIAIPSFLRARMAANDSSAAASIRAIANAEITYFNVNPGQGFPAAMTTLGGPSPCTTTPVTGCFIDDFLATNGGGNGKSGFNFAATASAGAGSPINNQFYITGTPMGSFHGSRAYCAVEDAVVRVQPAGIIALVPSYNACQALAPMNP
jgi:prepilin-type N-terminal cleavage/methylation domain-containing protein